MAEASKQRKVSFIGKLVNRRRPPELTEECEAHKATVPDKTLTDQNEDILNYDELDDPDSFV